MKTTLNMSMMVPFIKTNVDQVVSFQRNYNLSVKLNTDSVAFYFDHHMVQFKEVVLW